jgi:membrane-bound lytic murein transglycosylase A
MRQAEMPASLSSAAQFVALALFCLSAGPAATAATAPSPPALKIPNSQLEPLTWADLNGWADDDHAAAFKAFTESCKAILPGDASIRESRPVFVALRGTCRLAMTTAPADGAEARNFFEKHFRPVRIATLGESAGFLTGYYEPIVEGSRTWSPEFQVPLYSRPSNLIASGRRQFGASYFPNKGRNVGRKLGRRKIVPYYDRAEIEEGILTGRQLEICWIKDPIDLLFIQIQGSARVRLADGSVLRVNYDSHNGHSYSPVGRFLIESGAIPREEMSMDRIRQWMQDNLEGGREIRGKNRSYVFFRETGLSAEEEPKGAQGVSLTPGRTIAVDRALHVYGTPFFIEAELPIDSAEPNTKFRRLMLGQDTGSAIVGAARADLYFGAGATAGKIAGRIRHPGQFAMLVPSAIDPFEVDQRMPLPKPRPPTLAAKDEAKEKTAPVLLPRPRPKMGRKR